MPSLPVILAVTVVISLHIETACSIQTGVGVTGVNINLAVESSVADLTLTGVACYLFMAGGAILTRRAAALADLSLTVTPRVARHTRTVVGIHQIHTVSSILTLMMAVIDIDVTVLPSPARLTVAPVTAL